MRLTECQLLIAQAYAAWTLPDGVLPHELRRCVALFYCEMQGRKPVWKLSSNGSVS